MKSPAAGRYRALLMSVLLAAAVLAVFAVAAARIHESNGDQARARITTQLTPHAHALTTSIDANFALLSGLNRFTTVSLPNGPPRKEFETYASGLSSGMKAIRSLQISPNGIVTFVYPAEGVVTGNDLLRDKRPEVAADIKRTLASDSIIISGPYELLQGGLGLVGRQTVRTEDGAFWGFTSMVLDVPPLLARADLASAPPGTRFGLRDGHGRVFAGDADVFDESPVKLGIPLPDGAWELAAVPAGGWDSASREGLTPLWIAAVITSLSLGPLLYISLTYQQRLRREVEKLDESNRVKSSFLSNMSHELRTPLNSVIALSAVLGRRLAGKVPDEEYGYLEVIERNGRSLLALINDILDLSRIEAGKEELSIGRFSIVDMIAEILDMIGMQADEKGVSLLNLVETAMAPLVSDPTKVRHILQNIISNAVKFTERGEIAVSATREGDDVLISVVDTGIGISADQLPHIFDEFRQADDSTSRKYGGTGLGLAIAQEYAHLLSGDITVRSTLGEGSTFTLRLPMALDLPVPATNEDENGDGDVMPETEPSWLANEPLQARSGKPVALVVEDNPDNRFTARALLEESFEVIEAENGLVGVELARLHKPDVILMDIVMPVMDGVQALAELRGEEATRDIPVIVVTASAMRGDRESMLAQGFDGYVSKPIDEELLRQVLRQVLEEK